MEETKFYSLVENGAELQVMRSLPEAALEWEINPEHRMVRELIPGNHDGELNHGAIQWKIVREIPRDELLDVLKMSRL